MRAVVATGLFATRQHWPPLQTAQRWIARAAAVLANAAGADATAVQTAYRAVLAEVVSAPHDPLLAPWATHFYAGDDELLARAVSLLRSADDPAHQQ